MSDSGRQGAAGLLRAWNERPLYLRILAGLVLGLVAGVLLGERVASLDVPAKLVLRVLGALAPVVVLLAVVHALMTAEVERGAAGKLARLLLTNTFVAIVIGLGVANLVRP